METNGCREIKEKIKSVFSNIERLNIMNVEDELQNKLWIEFNKEVLKSYGIEKYYEQIKSSLISLRQVRAAAVEKLNSFNPKIHAGLDYNKSFDQKISMAAEPES